MDFSATVGRSAVAVKGLHAPQNSNSNSNSSTSSRGGSSMGKKSNSTGGAGDSKMGSKGAEQGPGSKGGSKRVVTYEASSLDDLAPAWVRDKTLNPEPQT